ncbi:hypothetical protein T492DRAFT_340338 [Pavlovales sp. CCMP2436]|nr:hypothetical protein T492DRAFT_340338 [Pavlovales sp. CCMP2436]
MSTQRVAIARALLKQPPFLIIFLLSPLSPECFLLHITASLACSSSAASSASSPFPHPARAAPTTSPPPPPFRPPPPPWR